MLDRDERGVMPTVLRAGLMPASLIYGALTILRRQAYGTGLLPVQRAGAPVISIGNLAAGGTGKTPLVEWTVRWLKAQERMPAVISRGYGALKSADGPDAAANDEILMLRQNIPGTPQFADPNRVRAAQTAVAGGADCLVLDDGFQHLRLHRNVNLVLFSAHHAFGTKAHVLPAGLLREPPSALRNADAVIISHAGNVDRERLIAVRDWLARAAGNAPLAEAVHRPTALIATGDEEPLEAVADRRALVFCGIGNPSSFLRTAAGLSAEVVSACFFPDHFHYTREDVARLVAAAAEAGAEVALTTQKDAVRMVELWHGDIPLRAVRVEFDFTAGLEAIEKILRTALS